MLATFFKVFPNGIVWSNDENGTGYDAVLFGQVDPTVIDVDELQERLDRPEYAGVKQSLEDVGFHSRRGSAGDLRGARGRSGRMDEGRANQHRPQPASAISGRHVLEQLIRKRKSSTRSPGPTNSPKICLSATAPASACWRIG